MENGLVQTLKQRARMSQRRALELIGLSRSAWHYRSKPRGRTAAPVPHRERAYPNRIDPESTEAIDALVREAWGQGRSVGWAFAAAWDQGLMVASQRTWWRVANTIADQSIRPVIPVRTGNRVRRPAPQVLATAPGHAWVWDITDLPTPYRGQAFKAYSIQDLYSRKIVGYRVEEREVNTLAAQMFQAAFSEHGVPAVVHSDSGAAMVSNELKNLLADHNVAHSFSRPRVSNDNAHKESEFRTMKHRPDYPGTFTTVEQARAWVDRYAAWFNTDHHHSGLALFTPNQVHDGTWRQLHTIREHALDSYYQAHPERFHRRPHTPTPDELVGINPPKAEEAAQTR